MKKFLIGLLAAASMIGSAQADLFYRGEVDKWEVRGWIEDGERSCVTSTFWKDSNDNIIGQLNINVFPRADGDFYLTLTLLHPEATTRNLIQGKKYDTTIWMTDEGVEEGYVGTFEKFGEKIIIRKLTPEFIRGWAASEYMVFFKDTDTRLNVSLDGTKAALELLEECLSIDVME